MGNKKYYILLDGDYLNGYLTDIEGKNYIETEKNNYIFHDSCGLYLYRKDGDTIRETTEEEKAEQYKQVAMSELDPITSYRIENDLVMHNNREYTYDKFARDNYLEFAVLTANGKVTDDYLAWIKQYMSNADITSEDMLSISKLIGDRKRYHISAHHQTVLDIMACDSVDKIKQVVEDYKNA